MNTGLRIKELRKLNNLKQKDMASRLSMSNTGYASWEQGLSEPNISQLKNLSKIFNTSVDYLLNIENEDYTSTVSISSTLPADEERVLQNYRQLNKSMKKLVEYYTENLIDIEKDRKTIN